MAGKSKYELVVIGASSGGIDAIRELLAPLPRDFTMTIAIVQHVAPSSDGSWTTLLGRHCALTVKEADEKEEFRPGTVFVAPANYHLLVERERSFSLTIDDYVNYARPSIDVLFETAAEALGPRVIGIVLTGANSDGARGLLRIRENGGLTLVQDPATAHARPMVEAAIKLAQPDHILAISAIRDLLLTIDDKQRSAVPQ